MSLQDTYYLVSIIAMSLIAIFFAAAVVMLFYIQHKASKLIKLVEDNLEKAKDIVSHPGDMAAAVGNAVVNSAVGKVSNFVHKKSGRKLIKAKKV